MGWAAGTESRCSPTLPTSPSRLLSFLPTNDRTTGLGLRTAGNCPLQGQESLRRDASLTAWRVPERGPGRATDSHDYKVTSSPKEESACS